MESRDKNRILNFTIIVLVLIVLILAVLALIMPICIMYFAEEKYLVDKYKQNKHAFATVKTELLYMLEQENEDELDLKISYDSEGKRIFHYYQDTDHICTVDANTEAYNLIDHSFGDLCWDKVYVSENYINFSEEGNNYQYIYCENLSSTTMIYGNNAHKIRKLGDGWYLVIKKRGA